MSGDTSKGDVLFHLSLNVADLNKSVAFYKALLGVEPAKCRPDYAKFEPGSPGIVLSLEPGARPAGGPLNHAGLRYPDTASLIAAQARLEAAGLSTNREEGVECCYARQTKFWVFDPDRTLWEIYVLEGDIEHRGDGQPASAFENGQAAKSVTTPMPEVKKIRTWEHRFGDPVADRLDFADESLDAVQLQGTFNRPVEDSKRTRLFREIHRVLAPGGKLHIRNLVADRPLSAGPLDLPGPASVVEAVPVDSDLIGAVEDAGFVDVALVHFDSKPCFTKGDVSMHQLRLEAQKRDADEPEVEVMYRGPFKQIVDDAGHTYRRGVRVKMPTTKAAALQAGPSADQWVVFPEMVTSGGCSG